MSYVPQQNLEKTAFGELSVAEPTPEVQISAVNGLRGDVQQIFAGTGAGVDVNGNNYECTSGTSPIGFASILSQRFCNYRNGQGLLARFTMLFPANAANSIQLAGLINGENAFCFGYNGTSFGVVRAYNGVLELQKLQVTTPAGGAENATVTVAGVGYTVPLTAGTVNHNALEIATSLTAQVANYTFTANQDTVTALCAVPFAQGAFAFTSGTAVAAWSQISAGAAPTYDWIPQANWTHPPTWALDPTKGNVAQIKLQYLGYGGIKFYLENPETTEFDLVHIYDYANQHTTPSVTDPSFRVGWAVQNLGNTTSLTVKGASAAGFVEGKKVFDEGPTPLSHEISGLSTTRQHILSIRNRSEVAGHANRVTLYPKWLVLSAAHNKTVIFHIDIGLTFSSDVIFDYYDEANSAVEYSTSASGVSADGTEVLTVRVRGTTPLRLPLKDILPVILPRQTVSITAETSSGTGAEADASIVLIEDP